LRTAECTPSQMPSAATSTIEIPASTAERWIASAIRGPIGRSIISDKPRSPRSNPPAQRRYCTWIGSSRRSFARTARICSSVANWPTIICATSPGITCVAQKMSTDITARMTAT
jgi:hypothetical protein